MIVWGVDADDNGLKGRIGVVFLGDCVSWEVFNWDIKVDQQVFLGKMIVCGMW